MPIHRNPMNKSTVPRPVTTLGQNRLLRPETARNIATPHHALKIMRKLSAREFK
jgi:hypothetical protein